MAKHFVFNERDDELVKQITAYQKENEIRSFIDAVRQLCKNALSQSVNAKINLK